MTIYGMSLNGAGSIWLDSTFNDHEVFSSLVFTLWLCHTLICRPGKCQLQKVSKRGTRRVVVRLPILRGGKLLDQLDCTYNLTYSGTYTLIAFPTLRLPSTNTHTQSHKLIIGEGDLSGTTSLFSLTLVR